MQHLAVAIIGSGPAGLTAAIYTSRARLQTTLFAGQEIGGQLMYTGEVENFPGFPEGKSGPLLMMDLQKQAQRFGTTIEFATVSKVDFSARPFKLWVQSAPDQEADYQAETVIISTGASSIMLGVPGEKEYLGRGVSTCAVCDAAFYKDKSVYVIGGGDSAMEDTMALSKFAKQVTVVHRRDTFKASKIMQERVLKHPGIKVLWNSQLKQVEGDGQRVTGLVLEVGGQEQQVAADGVFLAIGHKPASGLFTQQLAIDAAGYIELASHPTYSTQTSVAGVFAAGDVTDHRYRQAIVSAGMGCKAALDAEHFLAEQE